MKKTTEDYLKTVCLLEKHGEVHGVAIADALGVSKPTVSNQIKRLIRDGYVIRDANFAIRLTENGRAIAEATLERNRAIRELLMGLGVDEETAEADACKMEHAISSKSFKALKILAQRQCLKNCNIVSKK